MIDRGRGRGTGREERDVGVEVESVGKDRGSGTGMIGTGGDRTRKRAGMRGVERTGRDLAQDRGELRRPLHPTLILPTVPHRANRHRHPCDPDRHLPFHLTTSRHLLRTFFTTRHLLLVRPVLPKPNPLPALPRNRLLQRRLYPSTAPEPTRRRSVPIRTPPTLPNLHLVLLLP
jgi:hypothetical protein